MSEREDVEKPWLQFVSFPGRYKQFVVIESYIFCVFLVILVYQVFSLSVAYLLVWLFFLAHFKRKTQSFIHLYVIQNLHKNTYFEKRFSVFLCTMDVNE